MDDREKTTLSRPDRGAAEQTRTSISDVWPLKLEESKREEPAAWSAALGNRQTWERRRGRPGTPARTLPVPAPFGVFESAQKKGRRSPALARPRLSVTRHL